MASVLAALKKFTITNSPAIMSGIAIVGVAGSIFLASKAGYESAQRLSSEDPHMSGAEKFELTWRFYIPTATVGAFTVGAIVGSTYISNRRLAALAVAYSLADKGFAEYKDKVVERIGAKKETDIRDAVAADRVGRNPTGDQAILQGTGGNVLFYDSYGGRYFYSDVETIRRAENRTNQNVINNMYASVADFYDEINLHRTRWCESVGWNTDNLLEVTFSTTMADDGRPCIVIDFGFEPIQGYYKVF